MGNVWPRGFPADQAGGRRQRVLAGKREQISLSSVGVVQSLIGGASPDTAWWSTTTAKDLVSHSPPGKMLALGPKTLVPFSCRATLLVERVFWGLLLPAGVDHGMADIWRSYIMQKIMWRMGLSVAYATSWVNYDGEAGHTAEGMDDKVGTLVRKIVDMELDCEDVASCITRLVWTEN